MAEVPVGPFDVTVLFTGEVVSDVQCHDRPGYERVNLGPLPPRRALLRDDAAAPRCECCRGRRRGSRHLCDNVGIDMELGSNVDFGFSDLNNDGKVYLDQILSDCAFRHRATSMSMRISWSPSASASRPTRTPSRSCPRRRSSRSASIAAEQELAHFSSDSGRGCQHPGEYADPQYRLVQRRPSAGGRRRDRLHERHADRAGRGAGLRLRNLAEVWHGPGLRQRHSRAACHGDLCQRLRRHFETSSTWISSVTVPTSLYAGTGNDQILGGIRAEPDPRRRGQRLPARRQV